MVTGADGTAAVQRTTPQAGASARLAETARKGSFAYARRTMSTLRTGFTVAGNFNVLQEGRSRGNVPQLRLLDASGARVVSRYRQNVTNGQLWISEKGRRAKTTANAGICPQAQPGLSSAARQPR